MFFDMHSDILFDIARKRKNGKKNIIKDDHLPYLIKGNMRGGIWTYYTDINNPLCDFTEAMNYILDELHQCTDYIQIVKNKKDFTQNKLNVLLGFESIQPIKDINHFQEMYQLGFRHAMLTWNEENKYATGVLGNDHRGLTDEGKEIIQFMNANSMIIDVSHANIQTFNDITEITTHPIIASHSNVYSLCPVKRNLQDFQIQKIIELDGTIGLTAVGGFINPRKPTVESFVSHINYLKEKGWIDHISIGFDFMDYLSSTNGNLVDLPSVQYTDNLIQELFTQEYTSEEIDKISYKNGISVIKKILK